MAIAEEFQLKNGVTVVHEYTPHTQVVSVQAWIKTGSVNENEHNNGISHFLEHILFKGTKNFKPDEIDAIVDSRGGQMNAGTSKDYTMYYITLPVEYVQTAYKVIADMVFNASFIPAEIDKEKPVVVQEIQRKFDNPTYEMWREGMAVLYAGTPYAREVIGNERNVNAFDRDMLLEYYNSHYHPTNTTLVVVGDIKLKEARALAEEYFNVKPSAEPAKGYGDKWKPALKEPVSKIFKKEVSQEYIMVGYQVSATAQDAPVYEVLTEVLAGGEYSLLNQEMKYSKGLVTAVTASEILSKNSGIYILHMITNPGEADKAVEVLKTTLDRFVKEGVSPHELQKAKNRLKSRTVFMKEKASSEASEIGYSYTLELKDYYRTYTDRIDQVTAEDVVKTAKIIFSGPSVLYMTVPQTK